MAGAELVGSGVVGSEVAGKAAEGAGGGAGGGGGGRGTAGGGKGAGLGRGSGAAGKAAGGPDCAGGRVLADTVGGGGKGRGFGGGGKGKGPGTGTAGGRGGAGDGTSGADGAGGSIVYERAGGDCGLLRGDADGVGEAAASQPRGLDGTSWASDSGDSSRFLLEFTTVGFFFGFFPSPFPRLPVAFPFLPPFPSFLWPLPFAGLRASRRDLEVGARRSGPSEARKASATLARRGALSTFVRDTMKTPSPLSLTLKLLPSDRRICTRALLPGSSSLSWLMSEQDSSSERASLLLALRSTSAVENRMASSMPSTRFLSAISASSASGSDMSWRAQDSSAAIETSEPDSKSIPSATSSAASLAA